MRVARSARLLSTWRERIGDSFVCAHTGRGGVLVAVAWRVSTSTGGDYGLFLTLRDSAGDFTARPAYVTLTALSSEAT